MTETDLSSEIPEIEQRPSSRQALLEAGTKLFIAKGYAGVSTRELAEAAKVNLGAIQYHFGSKARLFVEVIKQTVDCSPSDCVLEKNKEPPRDIPEAAERLGYVILEFFHYLLRPAGPQSCRLMFREILSETVEDKEMFDVLVSSFVSDSIEPFERGVSEIVGVLDSSLSAEARIQTVRSVAAQCSFYFTHRPFIERMYGRDLSGSPLFEETILHVVRFTLRALRVKDEIISETEERVRTAARSLETKNLREVIG